MEVYRKYQRDKAGDRNRRRIYEEPRKVPDAARWDEDSRRRVPDAARWDHGTTAFDPVTDDAFAPADGAREDLQPAFDSETLTDRAGSPESENATNEANRQADAVNVEEQEAAGVAAKSDLDSGLDKTQPEPEVAQASDERHDQESVVESAIASPSGSLIDAEDSQTLESDDSTPPAAGESVQRQDECTPSQGEARGSAPSMLLGAARADGLSIMLGRTSIAHAVGRGASPTSAKFGFASGGHVPRDDWQQV
jgi:hypothetical protein